ncbi:unnamed protein product [Linum trigynum]|uniref:Uncharacterized protein n=1 Tax=Linum trigynum TaxID=586398 RepID=A0AAV2FQA0_9ROSI
MVLSASAAIASPKSLFRAQALPSISKPTCSFSCFSSSQPQFDRNANSNPSLNSVPKQKNRIVDVGIGLLSASILALSPMDADATRIEYYATVGEPMSPIQICLTDPTAQPGPAVPSPQFSPPSTPRTGSPSYPPPTLPRQSNDDQSEIPIRHLPAATFPIRTVPNRSPIARVGLDLGIWGFSLSMLNFMAAITAISAQFQIGFFFMV